VTPAPDAEPPAGSGQNTGVSGATYAVAENEAAGNKGRRPRPAPIRYAHSGAGQTAPRAVPADAVPTQAAPTQAAPTQAAPTQAAPTGEMPIQGVPAKADYDGTAGLVYEAPYPAHGEQPAYDEPVSYPEYADGPEPGEPEDDGLAILGGMATTEVPESTPSVAAQSPMDYEMAYEPPRPPPAEPPTVELQPVGASWNQPITQAPQPVGNGVESRPRPFGRRIGARGTRTWRRGPAPGPGGSKAAIRDLPPDVQMRFYRLRVTIMIIVGLVFGILTRLWEVGVTLAILAGIADTVWRSRNAASYANGAPQGGAQKRTRRQLAKMRRAGYFALDARPIPNSPEVIDHLVIGPTGVYAIDSEKWNPKLPIRTWNGKKLYHGPDSQKPRLEHAAWEAKQASDILSAALGSEIVVRPALAIYGPKIPWDIAEIRNVDVFSGPALRKYLRRRSKTRDGVPKLTREQVRTIYDTASRLLPDLSQTPAAATVG